MLAVMARGSSTSRSCRGDPHPRTGVQSTCSIRGAPVASITSRSRPSAMPPPPASRPGRRGSPRRSARRVAIEALLLGHVADEAAALLGGVGEFAEGVGELDAADIELEALGDARAPRAWAAPAPPRRSDSRRGWWPAEAEIRLDPLDHDAAEDVRPAVVVRDADAAAPRRPRPGASRLPSAPSSVARRSMPAWRAKASATVSRSGSANGSAMAPRQEKRSTPAVRGGHGQQRGAVAHQRLVGRPGAVPFQHGELGMVQRRCARDCGTPARS